MKNALCSLSAISDEHGTRKKINKKIKIKKHSTRRIFCKLGVLWESGVPKMSVLRTPSVLLQKTSTPVLRAPYSYSASLDVSAENGYKLTMGRYSGIENWTKKYISNKTKHVYRIYRYTQNQTKILIHASYI